MNDPSRTTKERSTKRLHNALADLQRCASATNAHVRIKDEEARLILAHIASLAPEPSEDAARYRHLKQLFDSGNADALLHSWMKNCYDLDGLLDKSLAETKVEK